MVNEWHVQLGIGNSLGALAVRCPIGIKYRRKCNWFNQSSLLLLCVEYTQPVGILAPLFRCKHNVLEEISPICVDDPNSIMYMSFRGEDYIINTLNDKFYTLFGKSKSNAHWNFRMSISQQCIKHIMYKKEVNTNEIAIVKEIAKNWAISFTQYLKKHDKPTELVPLLEEEAKKMISVNLIKLLLSKIAKEHIQPIFYYKLEPLMHQHPIKCYTMDSTHHQFMAIDKKKCMCIKFIMCIFSASNNNNNKL